ncbi:unnamed protein product [Alopecurus aequalis]
MAHLGTLIAGLLIKWKLEHYVLLRIRILVQFIIIQYYTMFFMSFFNEAISRSNALRAMDTVCDTLLVYVVGSMQAAPFKNQMFPIWAVLLVSSRSSFNTMSKYDTFFELRNMLKLWAAALLNAKHGSKSLCALFWLFWGILVVKSLYRIRARKLASKSLWHGRSSELVQEYMGVVDHNLRNFNPDTLEGCKFLVYGESKKNITKRRSPSINNLKSVVALDNIWLHDGSPLLRLFSINGQKNTIKDLTLAFALSRLLRCRMEGGRLHENTFSMTNKLISSRIIRTDDNAVLAGILLMDLSFLCQHIHTGYPMVFCQGLRSLCFPALLCVAQLTFSVWLFGWLVRDLYIAIDDADAVASVEPILMILVMGIFELIKYMSSNWTLLLLACSYVNCGSNTRMDYVFGKMISSALVTFTWKQLVLFTGQYDFLQSPNYSEGKLRPLKIHFQREKSMRSDYTVVITTVIQALARYMDGEGSCLPSPCLTSPRVSDRAQRYWSACLELPSCSHAILVWHIATSLCQVKLEKDRSNTNHRGLFRLFGRNTRRDLSSNLKKANMAAKCLSRYCLHLLIAKPNLLPENVLASKKLLLDTIQHAHDLLRGCNSPQSKYDELIALSQEAVVHAGSGLDIKLTGNILWENTLIQGAMMGKELIDNEDEEGRWDILAEVWADILIHIAPSSKTEAHGKALQVGVELVTLVWALLCHCGIEKSELWTEER